MASSRRSFGSRGGGGRGRGSSNHQRFEPKSSSSSTTPAPTSCAAASTSTTTSTTTATPATRKCGSKNYPNARRLSASLRGSSSPSSSSTTTTTTTSSSSQSTTTNTITSSSSSSSSSSSRGFVKYLPKDETVASGLGAGSGGLDTVESQAFVDLLNDELSSLLRLNPRFFWREVASNNTLLEVLDSYLLSRNRWYDLPHRGPEGTVAGIIAGDADLCRRVFMTFYRMSSNRDPGAPPHDCLSAKAHMALVQDKKLLDLPKLLDICAIYGHDNEELTRTLVNNAIKAQPTLAEMLPEACHQFLRIASTMQKRCCSSLEALASTTDWGDKGRSHLYSDLLEVVDFLNDAIVTLDAFVDAYRQAAIYFSFLIESSNGNQELINALASLHDSLLPSLHEAFVLLSVRNQNGEAILNGKVIENIELSLKLLSFRVTRFGYKILEICYLSNEFHDDTTLKSCGKIFPSQVGDPVIRGDILLQTFRDVSHHSNGLPEKNCPWGTFLQIIDKNYYLLSRVDSLRSNGWIFVDGEQFRSLTQTITSSSDIADKLQEVSISTHSTKIEINEDDIIMESKISQIKDIFPEYGKGFLAACLDVYDQNPEEVIQRILEGTLHEDLLSLDTSLEQNAPSNAASRDVKGKGKGILVDPAIDSKDKGKGLLNEQHPQTTAGWSSSAGPMGERDGDGPLLHQGGRFTRKSNNERSDSKILDSKAEKDLLKSNILAAADYEDDYDDSFDDLGLSVAEPGTEEADMLGDSSSSEVQKNDSRWRSRKTSQFYVKDGKNYSYKISGSIAVSDAREAAALVQSQKELIYGLGRGGNIPYGVARRPMAMDDEALEGSEVAASGGRGMENSSSRGRGVRQSGKHRGRGRGGHVSIGSEKLDSSDQVNASADTSYHRGQHNHPQGRGSGRGRDHHRKDRAMKKHFSGLTGY